MDGFTERSVPERGENHTKVRYLDGEKAKMHYD
jgi:hypothetical protein